MTLDEAIITRLSDSAAVAAIVGDRVLWGFREQGAALPAVVLTLVGQERPEHLAGPQDMISSRLQADCFAATHALAWDLAAAVRDALLPVDAVGAVKFWRARFEGMLDFGGEVEGTGFVHRAVVELTLRHTADAN